MCGTWVDDHIVTARRVGSTTTERGSMNAGMSRCWRYSRSMTMPSARALAMASSTSPPVPASASRASRRRTCWCRGRGGRAPSSVAASEVERPPAASRSRRRSARRRRGRWRPSGRRRRPRSRRRRRPGRWPSARCAGVIWSAVIGQALASDALVVLEVLAGEDGDDARRRPCAAVVSIEVIFACAIGLRTTAMWSMPGSMMLSVQRGAAGDQPRRPPCGARAWPTSAVAGRSSVRSCWSPPSRSATLAAAACCTALTMLW